MDKTPASMAKSTSSEEAASSSSESVSVLPDTINLVDDISDYFKAEDDDDEKVEEVMLSLRACTYCRKRKQKCDRITPACGRCSHSKQTCVYPVVDNRSSSSSTSKPRARPHDSETPKSRKKIKLSPRMSETPETQAQHERLLDPYSPDVDKPAFDTLVLPWNFTLGLLGALPDTLVGQVASTNHLEQDVSVVYRIRQHKGKLSFNQPNSCFILSKQRQQKQPTITSPRWPASASEATLLRQFESLAPPLLLAPFANQWYELRFFFTKMAECKGFVKDALCAFMETLNDNRSNRHEGVEAEVVTVCTHFLQQKKKNIRGDFVSDQILLSIYFLMLARHMAKMKPNASLLLAMVSLVGARAGQEHTYNGQILRGWIWKLSQSIDTGALHLTTSVGKELEECLKFAAEQQAPLEQFINNYETAIFTALTQPLQKFLEQIHNISMQIAQLDPWHRSHGPIVNLEVALPTARELTNKIELLWANRPPLIDITNTPMPAVLSEELHKRLNLALGVCTANYYACTIALDRHLSPQPSPNVYRAVNSISTITKALINGDIALLPPSMLWPLVLGMAELMDGEDRRRFMGVVENFEKDYPVVGALAKEIVKRQDATRVRIDVRSVLHDVLVGTVAQ